MTSFQDDTDFVRRGDTMRLAKANQDREVLLQQGVTDAKKHREQKQYQAELRRKQAEEAKIKEHARKIALKEQRREIAEHRRQSEREQQQAEVKLRNQEMNQRIAKCKEFKQKTSGTVSSKVRASRAVSCVELRPSAHIEAEGWRLSDCPERQGPLQRRNSAPRSRAVPEDSDTAPQEAGYVSGAHSNLAAYEVLSPPGSVHLGRDRRPFQSSPMWQAESPITQQCAPSCKAWVVLCCPRDLQQCAP
ncbi:hypothetical protein CYMTET_52404, partial [Cymbomonas tetramitiformis]